MPTKQEVLRALERAGDYEGAARELGIPAGRAYLIATGTPADGSPPLDRTRAGLLPSAQRLVNPDHHNPLRKQHVVDWVQERARRDLTPPR